MTASSLNSVHIGILYTKFIQAQFSGRAKPQQYTFAFDLPTARAKLNTKASKLSCALSNGPAPKQAKSEYLDAMEESRLSVDEVDAEEV